MADDLPEDVTDTITDTLGDGDKARFKQPARAGKHIPTYKLVTDTRIPVSKSRGALWKTRYDAGIKSKQMYIDAHKEALEYYHNDQMRHRTPTNGRRSGNTTVAKQRNESWSQTENLVFANTTAIVPMIYAKNPQCEITSYNKEQDAFAATIEKFVNALASMQDPPGLNMKPKIRQAVVLATLTNEAWIEIHYTTKQQATETVRADYDKAIAALRGAKTTKAIEEAEGILLAIEEQYALSESEGPSISVHHSGEVLVDPMAAQPDHSDAKWMMVHKMFPTSYLNAVYGKKVDDEVKSVFKPTHVLSASTPSSDHRSLTDLTSDDHKSFGYDSKDAFDKACYTQVLFVYDKITRNIEMYNSKDWSWPLWVWEDTFGFPNFFPFERLSFHTPPIGANTLGEVTYYLDQQDAINEMHDERKRARTSLKRTRIYNSNMLSKDEATSIIDGNHESLIGLPLNPGIKLSDVMMKEDVSHLNVQQLFDPSIEYQAISHITGISEQLRSAQFKTNTTNRAIEKYTSTEQTRLDEKIDAIEDFIGRIMRKVAALSVMWMDVDTVRTVLGDSNADVWNSMSAREFLQKYPMQVVGGSTQKPTSAAKKAEAMQVAQVMGQFANAAPAVLLVVLRMLEESIEGMVVDRSDWDDIRQSITEQMQRGNTQQQPQQGATGEQVPPQGAPSASPPAPTPNVGGDGNAVNALMQFLDNLPPEFKQAFGTSIAQGVPAKDALMQIAQAADKGTMQ